MKPTTAVDVPRAIDGAIERSVAWIGTRPVAVVAEYPAHLPGIAGDQQVLTGVLASLIGWGLARVERGEVRIRAALHAVDETRLDEKSLHAAPAPVRDGGPWVVLTLRVSGEGAGPDPAAAPLEGLLDLADCQAQLEGFGGHLWREDLPGPAWRVSLALPLTMTPAGPPDLSPIRRHVAAKLPSDPRTPATLLLVVDNPEFGDLLIGDLSAAGYEVMLAGQGSDALAIARQVRPSLILLDLMIRHPNAFEFALLLKHDRRTRRVPVLFLTLVRDEAGELTARAVNFLVRPAGTGALVEAINVLLTSGMSPSARVLVAEPDRALRDAMVMMIQAHGYRVTEATGAEEALALAERVPLGLILVNARLAQERDFWLLRRLRQASAEAGIYVLAEGLSEAEGRAAIQRGASGYSETDKLPDLLNRMREPGESR